MRSRTSSSSELTSWRGAAIFSTDLIRATLPRSAAIVSAMPGYCTLTATASPSAVIARCTCPIEAAAIGRGSHSLNTFSGASPSSALIMPAASSADIGGTLSWSRPRTRRAGGAIPSST